MTRRTAAARPRVFWLLAGLGLTAGAVGCSLTNIVDVKVGYCESDKECTDALNPDAGNYVECAAFQCVDNQCQPIENEICDGLDNDCDRLIDEPNGSDAVLSIERDVLAEEVSSVLSVASARAAAFSRLYVQQSGARVSVVDPETGETAPAVMRAQASQDDLETDLVDGCFTFSVEANAAVACDIDQLAVAAGSTLGYFAQIASSTCARGVLRVGVIDPEEEEKGTAGLIDRGPTFRSPAYRGVMTNGSPCTNNGRAACTLAKDEFASLVEQGQDTSDAAQECAQHCGVSNPSVGALADQGLVTFVGIPATEDKCGGSTDDVYALLLHGRTGSRDGNFSWGDPSNDGMAEPLGQTTVSSPPAVQGLNDAGFVVAHSNEDGDVTLTWIPRQENPPSNSGWQCPGEDCESREGISTEAISGIEEIAVISSGGGGSAHSIRIALAGEPGDSELSIGISWIEGCPGESGDFEGATAYFKLLRLELQGTSPPAITLDGPKLDLGASLSSPISVGSDLPFLVEGLDRSGKTASAADTSGFFVLTRTNAGSRAKRVSLLDGKPIESDESIEVGSRDDRYSVALGLGAEDAFAMQTAEGLEIGTFTCR